MSKVYLTKTGSFRAKHSHGGALAEPLHEHTFRYEATFYGELNDEHFLVDFRVLAALFKQEIEEGLSGVDLSTLLPMPTTEALAIWLYGRIKAQLPQLYAIKVAETPDAWIEYRGEA